MAHLAKLSDEGDALYAHMLESARQSEEGMKKVFYQSEVQTLADENAKTVEQLLRLIQELVSHSLLRTSRHQNALCWSTRPRAAANSIRSLSSNERLVYEHIEAAHDLGVWSKTIKVKTKIEDKLVERALTRLESMRLVKQIRNVKAPAQKIYMLMHLAPSDEVTGGSFYDGGDLDESLIEEVGNLIVFHVSNESWATQRVRRPKRHRSAIALDDEDDMAPGAELSPDSKRKKRKHTADIEDAPRKHRSHKFDPETDTVQQLAHPAFTKAYPTAEQIHHFITTNEAIRQSKAMQLTVAEIQSVIDVLVWDDKLERIGDGYRTVRGVSFRPPGFAGDGEEDDEEENGATRNGNGLTQAPCGKCPVFDLCGPGAPVNASNCVYFQEWLGQPQ
jgi:DNA-directed RNA polymerase III subunit RPC6